MQDITQWFKQSCSALPSGQMVKPKELSMLDAMNALQIMDPKMDTGVHQASSSRLPFDPKAHMSPQDICWTMDQMLAFEVAWYRGATLCQSVYTSLHYHNPHLLAGSLIDSQTDRDTLLIQLVLRAYVLLYCKTIDLVYSELAKGHVHDGEDCWLDHYGIAVRMSDPVADVVYLADDALGWLESDDNSLPRVWREQLIHRLVFRRNFVRYLDSLSQPASDQRTNILVMRMVAESIEIPPPPSDTALACFDSNMPAYLRQSMPLPTFNSVVPKEAWGSVRNLVTDLLRLEDLRKSASLSAWDNVGWSTEKRLAILRSITKTGFLAVWEQQSHGEGVDKFTQARVLQECGVDIKELADLTNVEPAVEKQINVWKALISGFLSSMMTASILNRPRQRRVLLSLSSTWRERAALGEYFSSQSKQLELQPYCRVLHAFRYDCLLEAALAAYDTGLVIPLDERESWWWIALVASARLAACPSQTWHARWAKVWTCIGTAMQLLLTITPLATSGKTSKPRFDLRYKHARKSLYLPNGLKVKSGLTPEYRDWIRDQDTLELREASL
nr:uncharacterized protein CI109_006862 [Kwoniella shandongensis]KAA5524774.1 hypothetical protein CI109_006862 [Kwoniella shandongensis]